MFGKLGQFADLMKNASAIQENMKKMKAELAQVEVSAKSADGLVEAWANGEMSINKIKIQPALLEGNDAYVIEKSVTDTVNSALFMAKA